MTAPAPDYSHFVAATLREVVASVQPHLASDRPPGLKVYEAVSGELRPLVYQVAEMAEHEPDNLRLVAEYLHGMLEREPLRSRPGWASSRVVLGLFLMGLSAAMEAVGAITAEERAALRPAYHREAGAMVRAAFDPVYIPPADEPHEEPMTDAAAPADDDDDPTADLL